MATELQVDSAATAMPLTENATAALPQVGNGFPPTMDRHQPAPQLPTLSALKRVPVLAHNRTPPCQEWILGQHGDMSGKWTPKQVEIIHDDELNEK
jgi:hypothetical protein